MRRALVTGAAGFIGQHLCCGLRQRGWHVTALSRKSDVSIDCDTLVTGDISGILPVNLCEGIDSVFHLAGVAHAFGLSEKDQSLYHDVNVAGTEHLLELVADSEVERVIYFSSIKAMADPGEQCVDESFIEKPEDAYGLSKLEAEQRVLAFGKKTSRHVVCLRPTLVYGPGAKGNLLRMLSAIERRRFPVIDIRTQKRSMISVNDLTRLAIELVDNSQANQQTYIVSDGESYTTHRLQMAMCTAMNVKPSAFKLPLWLWRFLAKLGDLGGRALRRDLPFNSNIWHRLSGSACYRNNKLMQQLSWQPSEKFEDVIYDIVHAYHQSKRN